MHSDHPILGKFNPAAVKDLARSIVDAQSQPEELRACYQRIAQLETTLGEVREYFESRADADCDQDGFIPNTEMTMMIEIDEVLL